MKQDPETLYLKDYRPFDYQVNTVFLHFELHETKTRVESVLTIERAQGAQANTPLVLNGEALTLETVRIDGQLLEADQYHYEHDLLTITEVPDQFTLETVVTINPKANTQLSGLYVSSGNFCTQCESHGFRRITFYPDRPDVLARFTVSMSADKDTYPVLLSNGNRIEQKQLKDNRHWVKWEDPTPKPCYLFALVAGDFDRLEDTYTTMSGRPVSLRIYVEKGKQGQAGHAMQSLKHAMEWDEKTYGREYDLDIYMIVAVSDFNFGAMENKGLNIFNDRYILADRKTATDQDYVNIEEVVGHEYFHNWSGNRVTVRDWFQITLKEGLTVFRDQSFTEDVVLKGVKRIQDANVIRTVQFAQDAGPMSHPIRPDHYIEVNNFYTVTVYNKGSEVIRMVQTLLGKAMFRKAMDAYFERFDGKAVTTEDFVHTMQDVSGIDLTQFERWYHQSGTPELTISSEYDEVKHQYRLTIKQHCPKTADPSEKKPFHIPLLVGLIDKSGNPIIPNVQDDRAHVRGDSILFTIKEPVQTFELDNVSTLPRLSLLRHFSAPVKVHYDYSDKELAFLMAHDSDDFSRWEAAQKLFERVLVSWVDTLGAGQRLEDQKIPHSLQEGIVAVIEDNAIDNVLRAELLTLPSERYLVDRIPQADVDLIHTARTHLYKRLGQAMQTYWTVLLDEMLEHDGAFSLSSMGHRRMHTVSLTYLIMSGDADSITRAMERFESNYCMDDLIGPLTAINELDCDTRDKMLEAFYEHAKHNPLMLDKWFSLHASAPFKSTLDKVKMLLKHTAYQPKNPNRVRALVGTFVSQNLVGFHAKDGSGYQCLVDQVLQADTFNPSLAARLVEPLSVWHQYDLSRQALMKEKLNYLSQQKLSKHVYEVVERSLRGAVKTGD